MSNKTINKRINFATSKILEYPDLLEVQLKSFKDFFQLETTPENRKNEGLYQVFQEIFPIEDTRNSYKLEFIDYFIDPPQYSIEECLDRGLTYNVPLKAKLRLSCTDSEHEGFETRVQDVYLGNIPYMTPAGTFVINGSERIIVSQLHRSPGVFFDQSMHANGTKLYSARIIPFKGSWIEFATDINNVMYAYIDRKKKLPVTTLLRAIGYNSDKDIIDIFDLADEVPVTRDGLDANKGRKLANNVLRTKFEDFIDEDTGEVTPVERIEILVKRGEILDDKNIDIILQSDEKTILLQKDEANSKEYAIIFNTLQKDPTNTEIEAVNYIYKQLRNSEPPDESTARDVIDKLFFSEKRYDLGNVGRYRLNKKLNLSIDPQTRVLTNTDIIEIIKYLIELINSKATVDDIDHLANRRVRTVGEQLANQFSVGLSRMARTIRERMNVRDSEQFNPIDLINAKTLASVINSFFGTSQLSQFMDQTNPLAEITHKRRLSALGPGGLSRERAGFEVRDVHYTHYGRLCPIESPEGPNIGLISSLCVYARIDDLGFIETPYRDVKDGAWIHSRLFCFFSRPSSELRGKTIGIFGYGAIGRRIAEIAKAFEMKVLATTRTPKEDDIATFVDFDTLLRESDYVSAKMFLNNISPSLISRQGTAIGAALNLAMNSFTPQQGVGKSIIVITDGENHEGGVMEAVKAASDKGIQVNVLGVGSVDGAPIPVSSGSDYKKDNSGNIVVTKLNEQMCQDIARQGNGIYARVDNTNSAFRALEKQLDTLSKADIDTKVFSQYNEQFIPLAWIVLVLLVLEALIMNKKNPLFRNVKLFS